VHGVSILYVVMGPGFQQVTRVSTPDTDFVVGVWNDGRIGTVRVTRKGPYELSAKIFVTKSHAATENNFQLQRAQRRIVQILPNQTSAIAPEKLVENTRSWMPPTE
jgi:hypothetical protein